MSRHYGRVLVLAMVVVLAGCAQTSDGTETADTVEPAVTSATSTSTSQTAASFPIVAFADISENPVSEEAAAKFEAALREMADGGGMSATVMTADGTWSGAVGKAHGARDMRPDDQIGIASISKSVTAAQVMQMVEAGELALNDPASEHLPPELDFDTNGATIRQLLSMHSGIPTYERPWLLKNLQTDRRRVWKPAELLQLVPVDRAPVGETFDYSSTNYILLGLVIEHVSGRPLADVMRDGVLGLDGTDRLVYQPDEVPTEPMAMPEGESTSALKKGGGYLPSLADATAGGAAFGMASDSPSLARWWLALCSGEIVSEAALTEMTTMHHAYGLGLYEPYGATVGHTGWHVGYAAWAGCLPEDGSVIVVLTNRGVENIGGMAGPLVLAVTSD